MAKGIKRTRAVSHKKNKALAVNVKLEYSKRKKATKPTSPIASKKTKKTNDDSGVDNRLALLSTPKKKGDLLYAVGESKVNLSFRPELDNYTTMIPQISKEISSNFSYNYRRRATEDRRSSCNVTQMTTNKASVTNSDRDIMLVDYTGCYVEDYMRSDVGQVLLVLIPRYCEVENIMPWCELFACNTKRVDVTFTKQSYAGFLATVVNNPLLSKVTSGMHISDYLH